MEKKINKLQMIQFELMAHVNLDGFDAKRVIGDLIEHKELWESVVMMPDPSWGLLHLRDLAENRWNVDCLYIYASNDETKALTELAQSWQPTELMWLDEEAQRGLMRVQDQLPRRVLRLFW
jgi:hypothetical protein